MSFYVNWGKSYKPKIVCRYKFKIMNSRKNWLILCIGLLLGGYASAKVTLPNVLTSNMVLQQKERVAIWGKAFPGEKVTVEFAGQSRSCIASSDSTWQVWLKPMKASFQERELVVKGEDNEIRLKNVLVGEVWLCGGQSNMEYPMDRNLKRYAAPGRGEDIAAKEWKNPKADGLRLFMVEKKYGLPDCQTKGWQKPESEYVAPFSAAAYFFGKTLYETLQVPVGIIASSWGGSRIENWMPKDVYIQAPFYKKEQVQHPKVKRRIALYYETMIRPLAPYTLKGFTWYQGESDAISHDSLYVEKFETLLNTWRTIFDDKNLPMYYVQIAPYLYSNRPRDDYKHDAYVKAWFSDLQTSCMDLKNTGQVIVTDLVDNPKDIHPSYKWEVGRRLALWALAKDYKQNVIYSGPQLKQAKLKGGQLYLTFNTGKSGLTAGKRDAATNAFVAVDDKLTWFEVAGKDGIFRPVEAGLTDGKVVLDVSDIDEPSKVRFGWNEKAMPNLFNTEGLPAMPFCVDL